MGVPYKLPASTFMKEDPGTINTCSRAMSGFAADRTSACETPLYVNLPHAVLCNGTIHVPGHSVFTGCHNDNHIILSIPA